MSLPAASKAQEARLAIERSVLEGGLAVLTQEDPGDMSAACIFIKVGAADEPKEKSGITNLLNHTLLSCDPLGRVNPPSLKIEQLGGSVSVETSSEYTCFRLLAPTKNFAAALKILADVFIRHECTEASLSREKEAQAASAWRSADWLEVSACRSVLQRTYTGHPYGLDPYGDEKSLAGITTDDLVAWFKRYYTSDRICVSICGRLSHAASVKIVRETFRPITALSQARGAADVQPSEWRVDGSEAFDESVPPGRAAAAMAYSAPAVGSQDYPAMCAVEAVLASGMGSMLFKALRDDNLYAYNFGSLFPPLARTSRLVLYVTTDEDRLDGSLEAMKKSVERVRSGSFSDDEFERARRSLMGSILARKETSAGRAYHAGFYELMGLSPDYDDRLVQYFEKMRREEAVKAAQRYMDNCTVFELKPKKGWLQTVGH